MVKPGAFTPSWNKSTINFSIGHQRRWQPVQSGRQFWRRWPGGGGGGNNTAADLAQIGTDLPVYADRYELKTNENVNDWSDLISFIDFINNTDLDAFGAGIDFRMDVDGLRSAALDMLFSNLDSYTGSLQTITSTTKTPTSGNGSNGTATNRLVPTPTAQATWKPWR